MRTLRIWEVGFKRDLSDNGYAHKLSVAAESHNAAIAIARLSLRESERYYWDHDLGWIDWLLHGVDDVLSETHKNQWLDGKLTDIEIQKMYEKAISRGFSDLMVSIDNLEVAKVLDLGKVVVP